MDQKEIFRKVGEIIKELNDQYQDLSKSPDKLNELEIELFMANANFLADHIKIIHKLNTKEPELLKPVEKVQEEPVEDIVTLPEEETIVPDVDKSGNEKKAAEEHPEPEHIKEDESRFEFEKGSEENIEEDRVENKEKEKKSSEPIPDPGTAIIKEVVIREKTISVDTPAKNSTDPAPTLNDVMASQLDQSTVAGKYNRQSVTDLKSIINLNDRLLFVKDLFNGYSLAYNEAIELLNRFDNFDSADNFLKTNYSVKNNWSEKQATVDKFYEMLNRRFTK